MFLDERIRVRGNENEKLEPKKAPAQSARHPTKEGEPGRKKTSFPWKWALKKGNTGVYRDSTGLFPTERITVLKKGGGGATEKGPEGGIR